MGYVYLITNKINNKKYVGKTELSIKARWKQHIKDSKKEQCETRPLYRAIRKYGAEHFSICKIDTGHGNELNSKEQYWIQYYNTYEDGYNATLGGDGKILLDYDEIIKAYLMKHNATEVAKTFRCSVDSVYKIMRANDIPILNKGEVTREKTSKKIIQYDKKGNFIKEYPSAMEAARQIGGENYMPNISRCANGKRKTANGYIWEWK